VTKRTDHGRTSRLRFRAAAIAAGVVAMLLATATGAATLAAGSPGSPASSGSRAARPVTISCAMRQLPTLGGPYGNATAGAANGDVVGIADDTAGVARAVLWRAGKPQLIRTGIAGSVPTGLNTHGEVVGNSPDAENTAGWLWSRHRAIWLRGRGDLSALPAAISNRGMVAGALEPSEGTPAEGDNTPGASEDEQAAVWRSPGAPPRLLAPLPGDQGAHAFAVDDGGRIGGVSEGARFRPVVWDLAGRPHPLPGLGGGYGAVRAFGPGGVAVGDAVAGNGTDHAVMWDARGRITDLGLPALSRTAQAIGVLPGGVVVGTAQVRAPGGGVRSQAVRWPAAGEPQLLGGQGGTGQTVVAGAMPAQTAVGYRTDANGGRHPLMWRCGR
jgi:uncharacterized membrane protein